MGEAACLRTVLAAGRRQRPHVICGWVVEAAHFKLDQLAIRTLLAQKLIGGTVLNDLSILQHDNPVEATQGRQAVSDGDDRTALHQVIEGVADRLF